MSSATGDLNETQLSTSFSSTESSKSCRHFEFPEILLATNNFDESLVIGHGGFGKVYKGNIINGSIVSVAAFKRLDSMSSQGATEFWAEVEMLSNLRHCHLVSLFGYCSHENEMILVYEYMPNGTLEDHLHSLGTPLSWLQRLKICISAARGLDYLHTGTGIDVGVIHRDVKSSNILLHESWAAKISDFGLSKIGPTNQPLTHVHTLVRGTFGYLDPDYSFTGRLTRKSDVYAFGVVLLEVLCRKRAVDESLGEEQWNLARWVQESIKEGNLKHIIDNGIRDEISPKCLKEFVRIAERCLLSNPKQRPMMAEVVVRLNYVLTLQQKLNISLQATDKTIFGKLLDMFPFASNGENSAHGDSKPSSNIKDTSRRNADDSVPVDNKDSTRTAPKLFEVYKFDDLEVATQNFLFLCHGSRDLFIGWVDKNTFTPSLGGMGIEVAVEWYSELQPKCQVKEDGKSGLLCFLDRWEIEGSRVTEVLCANGFCVVTYNSRV
ncbi:receptor-like protein kinase FERONIA [Lactuca sativa]|uniref:receptor-like protein kinase FERONIA n=1 Tax=Lactuca sativa TaxID=4236 RepID=UPI000CD8958E|nr:receptor-like protein kinase FERONIA [Lactuca sativa]